MNLQVIWAPTLKLWQVVNEHGHVLFGHRDENVARDWARSHSCPKGNCG